MLTTIGENPERSDTSTVVLADEIDLLKLPIFDEPPLTKEAIDIYNCQLASLLLHEENTVWWNGLTAEERAEHVTLRIAQYAGGSDTAARIMQIGSQKKLKAVVERGQYWEAALLLQSERKPLEKLQRLLWVMEMQDLPSYEYLSNETCDVVQAVDYCKCLLLPGLTRLI